jgi:hypothetical protein
MVVLIGSQWVAASDFPGRLRLTNPGGLVRNEIRTALATGLTVIPVLSGGAAILAAADLPEAIAGLARRNAVALSDANWDGGIDVLTRAIASASTQTAG